MSTADLEQSSRVIGRFHACLNKPDLVPERAYRRDHTVYLLVSYVNHITGLFLSNNLEGIPIFIARAAEHMAKFLPGTPKDQAYYGLVSRYLMQMAHHLEAGLGHADFAWDRVPAAIKNGGPQTPP